MKMIKKSLNIKKIFNLSRYLFLLINFIIFLKISFNYEYDFFIFSFFALVTNIYLFISLSKNSNFFHFFISFLLWLGFWINFALNQIFIERTKGHLSEVRSDHIDGVFTTYQQYSENIDNALIVSSVGIAGFLLSCFLQNKIFPFTHVDKFYKNKATFLKVSPILFGLVLFFTLIVALSNFNLNIYQRGIISNPEIHFLIKSSLKWLLLFGLSTFFGTLIFYEYILKKKINYISYLLIIFENFISSISILSRGMFVNTLAILYSIWKINIFRETFTLKKILIFTCIALIMIFISLERVTELRNAKLYSKSTQINELSEKNLNDFQHRMKQISFLFFKRFVGFEAVLGLTAVDNLGFDLLKSSFSEKVNLGEYNFYVRLVDKLSGEDTKFQSFETEKVEGTYFIKVPGMIAYLYYSGSLYFIFLTTFLIGLIFSLCERIIYKISNYNFIFTSIISQVFAYRIAHFGYVPTQTYLLLLTVIINMIIVYVSYEIFKRLK